LRDWRDEDRDPVIAISHAVYPEYASRREVWLAAHQIDSLRSAPIRLVAEHAATRTLVGYASVWPWKPETDRYRLDLIVHPRRQRQGIGDLLLARCLEVLHQRNAQTVQARVRDDHPEGIEFLTKRGFVETQRMYGLSLDVPSVSADLIETSIQHVIAKGITLRRLAAVEGDQDAHMHHLHDLHNAVVPDWPDPDPGPTRSVSFEDFTRELAALRASQDNIIVAIDGNRFVGYALIPAGMAAHPECRDRGIATALKAFVINEAKKRAIENIFTCTANPALRHVNEKLGYRHVRTEVRLVRSVQPSTNAYLRIGPARSFRT
jgi:GNAT superfamily N-acetyltransferase